jgi:hypothetical protein
MMDKLFDRIDPDRLCDAADAVLQAVQEISAERGGSSPAPTLMLGMRGQPACLNGYTEDEIEAATMMLMRLDMLRGTRVA